MRLLIEADGTVRFIYTEAIDFSTLGPPAIKRASHVEPGACGQ